MSSFRVVLLLISAGCVSAAMPLHGGHFGMDAIVLITIGFVANLLALVGISFNFMRTSARPVALIIVLMHAVLIMVYKPAAYAPAETSYAGFYAFLIVFLASAGMSLFVVGRWTKWALLAAFVLPAGWVLWKSADPFIDTFVVHQESCEAFLHGRNPYGIHVTNLYGADGTKWLPPEFVTMEKMLFGYPYPPVTLLLSMPGYIALEDARYSMLAAVVVAAGLMTRMHRGATAVMSAVVFLSFSRMFEVLESSWTDTYLVMLLALCVYCATRKSKLLPWGIGLLLVSKQYTVLMIPATLLLLPWPLRWKDMLKFYSKAIIAGVVVILPFIVTQFDGFMAGVVKMHLAARPRDDSLSFSAFFKASEWGGVASLVAFGACFMIQAIALRLAPRSAFGFALTVSSATFGLFIFGKGFMNYYFFIFGAMCCAMAAAAQVQPAETLRSKPVTAAASDPA
jgi:hypothetical protein